MQQQSSSPVSKTDLVHLYRQALQANVPLDVLEEKVGRAWQRANTVAKVEQQTDKENLRKLTRLSLKQKIVSQGMPIASVLIGCFLIGSAVVPISQSFIAEATGKTTMLAPIPTPLVLAAMPVQASTASAEESITYKPKVVANELDYTNLSNWFPNLHLTPSEAEEQVEYQLDIPSLRIERAKIKIGGTNLDHSLIQYPGTAEPGQLGSPVIFGHSILRQFYNPSVNNTRRYFSIFSTIMTLKTGDKIYVTRDSVRYTYVVTKKDVVKPEDTFILEQAYDAKRLKLVTCVPEGTYLRRGVVTAELVAD